MINIKKLSELHESEIQDERKRILKILWDTIHEGHSIDTVSDQNWFYELLRHQIEDVH